MGAGEVRGGGERYLSRFLRNLFIFSLVPAQLCGYAFTYTFNYNLKVSFLPNSRYVLTPLKVY